MEIWACKELNVLNPPQKFGQWGASNLLGLNVPDGVSPFCKTKVEPQTDSVALDPNPKTLLVSLLAGYPPCLFAPFQA